MTMNPRPLRQFTAAEFWKMYDLGFFNDQRVELIGGEIVATMTQSNWHWAGVSNVQDALELVFPRARFAVRNQATLDLSPLSVPDPDITVVSGSKRSWGQSRLNPTAGVVLLIVEVSDTTLATDRGRKASLYAASGVAEYWILNLVDSTLEVRRDPRPDATQDFAFGYASLATLTAADFATPLAAPTARIAVADLLPT